MKEDTKKRLSELIIEELSEKIRKNESLRKKLEAFADLPVEKVADAILNQFEYLLSSELRDLIIYLIEQEVETEKSKTAETPVPEPTPEIVPEEEPVPSVSQVSDIPTEEPAPVDTPDSSESIMEHFAVKEPFPSEPMDFELKPDDWFYIFGFSYAPDSMGKGIPTRKLSLKGIDGVHNVFMIDYGDIRLYVNKIIAGDFTLDKSGKPILTTTKSALFKYDHERILNLLRSEDLIMSLPFWTVIQGHERIINRIEDHYVEMLRILIDIQDAVEWDVEVFAFDRHISEMPSIAEETTGRASNRETKHPAGRGGDMKLQDKVMIREKRIAQDIHNSLLLSASKAKIDHIIRLDNAVLDDWKSILAARYTVGRDRRKMFCQGIRTVQKQYEEFQLMIRVSNPNIRYAFT